jgi:hypothetical protein
MKIFKMHTDDKMFFNYSIYLLTTPKYIFCRKYGIFKKIAVSLPRQTVRERCIMLSKLSEFVRGNNRVQIPDRSPG